MRSPLMAVTALLLIAPAASAHHWAIDWVDADDDLGDSGCEYSETSCGLDYLCTGGAPSQAVDLVLYCALRAAGEAEDVAIGLAHLAYAFADFGTEFTENLPGTVHDAGQDDVDGVNVILCTQVWSFFCSNPIILPEHIPIGDPVGPYPAL